jgi:hypothetical protein
MFCYPVKSSSYNQHVMASGPATGQHNGTTENPMRMANYDRVEAALTGAGRE